MKYKFQKAGRVWRLIILALLAVLLWIWVWNASKSSHYDVPGSPEIKFHNRRVREYVSYYCNFPMRTSGAEGLLDVEDQRFQLEMTQVLIRHGDRAPAIYIPNMDNGNYDFDCTFETSDYSHKKMFDEYSQTTRHFIPREFVRNARTDFSLLPSGRRCQIGQLTQRGFLQHFALGKHMRTAYKSLINTGIESSNLHVRSTHVTRCVQSAAAFLYGFLTKDAIMRESVTINITSNLWFQEDENGVLHKCPSLRSRWNQYKQRSDYISGSAAIEPLMQQFSRVLRTSRPSLTTIVFLTDAIYTRYCYNHALPCGPGGCVSPEMAAKAMDFAMWAFAENFTGIADVATHPILIQIAKRMMDKSQQKSSLKFVLYSGHDSTVTPLLINLGVHDSTRYTPYAARVVFELWRDTLLDTSEKPDSADNFYFRVLVNGEVVTSQMKFCGDSLLKGELCPVSELVSWLSDGEGFKGMDEKYRSLCSMI